MKKDYYELLGINKNATSDAIKRAYRKMAKQHHPDMNPDNKKEAGEKFKEISEAYEVLMDPQKKQMYDQYGHAGISQTFQNGNFDFGRDFHHFDDLQDIIGNLFGGSIFSDFFGGAQRTQRRGPQRGGDIHVILSVSLEEIVGRARKKFKVPRYEACSACGGKGGHNFATCPQCGGRGQVRIQSRSFLGTFASVSTCPQCSGRGQIIKDPCTQCTGNGRIKNSRTIDIQIPQGIAHGQYIVLRGEGHYGRGGKGSILVEFEEKPHDYYQRKGYDLYIRLLTPYSTLINGGIVQVPGLNGTDEKVRIPKGSSAPEIVRARGKGLPRPEGGRGDLYVELDLQPLKSKDRNLKKIIDELKEYEAEATLVKRKK